MARADFEMRSSLIRRLDRFWGRYAQSGSPLSAVVQRVQNELVPAVLIGGTLRNLMLHDRRRPRDVDIVVSGISIQEVDRLFANLGYTRRTRFGGLHLDVGADEWSFDIWPLENTWAFEVLGLRPIVFEELPKTTFLNLDAIAVKISPEYRCSEVFECGFFQAISSHTIDINLAENPFPALASIRSLVLARDTHFAISLPLATYIIEHLDGISQSETAAVQRQHYGSVKYAPEALEQILGEMVDVVGHGVQRVRFRREIYGAVVCEGA